MLTCSLSGISKFTSSCVGRETTYSISFTAMFTTIFQMISSLASLSFCGSLCSVYCKASCHEWTGRTFASSDSHNRKQVLERGFQFYSEHSIMEIVSLIKSWNADWQCQFLEVISKTRTEWSFGSNFNPLLLIWSLEFVSHPVVWAQNRYTVVS